MPDYSDPSRAVQELNRDGPYPGDRDARTTALATIALAAQAKRIADHLESIDVTMRDLQVALTQIRQRLG